MSIINPKGISKKYTTAPKKPTVVRALFKKLSKAQIKKELGYKNPTVDYYRNLETGKIVTAKVAFKESEHFRLHERLTKKRGVESKKYKGAITYSADTEAGLKRIIKSIPGDIKKSYRASFILSCVDLREGFTSSSYADDPNDDMLVYQPFTVGGMQVFGKPMTRQSITIDMTRVVPTPETLERLLDRFISGCSSDDTPSIDRGKDAYRLRLSTWTPDAIEADRIARRDRQIAEKEAIRKAAQASKRKKK